ncbi:hypothetical protein Hanom_Chr00s011261g01747351 [Helianthus anomalus]
MDSSTIDSCITNEEISERFSKPMFWVGIYIAAASFFCTLAMAADLLNGFRNKKFWFPSKYFSLNAASITVITIALKLPVDLTTAMPSYVDQAAKVGSLGFLCTMMANLMPSLASMDNKTLLANLIGLCILVITVLVNVCIQIYTGVIDNYILLGGYMNFPIVFTLSACIYMLMILLLLIIIIFSSLTIPTYKEILESKYQAISNISLVDQGPQNIQMSRVDQLRQHVRRYWVMAETGSPQFAMASNPLSTASGVICVMVLVMNVVMVLKFVIINYESFVYEEIGMGNQLGYGGSPYKWSASAVFLTQSIGCTVGIIAPISRCFLVFSFKNYFMVLKVEKYWTQKLQEWRESPIRFLSSSRRSRSLIYNSKTIFLRLCIGFQKVIVIMCKVIWLIVTIVPVFVVRCFTPLTTSRTDDIDTGLKDYVLQIDNERELAEQTLKGISKSMNSFISKAEKEQPNNLLELLKKSTGFQGVEIFDADHVQPLHSVEFVNSWSLPIVTLTCIAVSLPNIRKDIVESLLTSVDEGLSFTRRVEESLNSASEYVSIQKATWILWHEIETKCRWLDNPLAENVFEGKTATEIIEWFSDKSKEIVTKISQSTNGEPVGNPSKALMAANSMYRITQTILLRYQSNTEPITKKQLFAHLSRMIADIFCACFTNIPRVIRLRCQESVIEKREASVKVAANLLGKTTKIIERPETREIPSMDDDQMAYIDQWRLYLRHLR